MREQSFRHAFKSIQHLFNNTQLPKMSFNTEEQCQNMNFNKPTDTSIIIHVTI